MDFIRKNWGLLLYSLGCCVLAVFIGLKIREAGKLAKENSQKLQEQLNWFESVKSENVKLNPDNERVAQDNRDRTEEKFREMRKKLAADTQVDPKAPATEVEAVRRPQNEIRKMNRRLDQADPPIDYSSIPYLSFRERAVSTELPDLEDVPRIFRQLRIVQEIVRILAQSGLQSLESIERPMGLEVIEEDLYTATPIRLTVTGTSDEVQTFINRMTTESNYLFFLRKLRIESADQAPSGALGASTSLGSLGRGMGGGMEGEGMGMDMGMGMEPGMGGMEAPGMAAPGGGMAPPAPGMRRRGTRGGMPGEEGMMEGMPGEMGMEPGMGMEGTGRRGRTEPEPMWREDLRAFVKDRPILAELRFDLIEFNQPEEDGEEE